MSFVLGDIRLHDEGAEEVFAWGFMLLGFSMVICPLWILVFVTESVQRLAIMTCFIFIFLVLVSFVTTARPFETLAATAA